MAKKSKKTVKRSVKRAPAPKTVSKKKQKQVQHCSACGEHGHNKRRCGVD